MEFEPVSIAADVNPEDLKDSAPDIASGTKEEVEAIQESLVMEVCEAYGRPYKEGDKSKPSMRMVAEQFGISPMKVKKILITGGLFQTDISDDIQRLYASGMSVKEIASLKNTSVANVNSYLPYERVVYNLDVRNEEAVKAFLWRRKQADHLIGRPTRALQSLFEETLSEFTRVYKQELNVQLFSCGISDGPSTFLYLIRSKGYQGSLPSGAVLSDYIQNMDSHVFMYGYDQEGKDLDGILIRADKPGLKETILRSLAEIYCRRYETDDGFFYRDNCEDPGDPLEQEIMRTGYLLWSGYIVEQIVMAVSGKKRDFTPTEVRTAAWDSLWHPESAVSVLLSSPVLTRESLYPSTRSDIYMHGVDIHIDKAFIHQVGTDFLIEQAELKLRMLRKPV